MKIRQTSRAFEQPAIQRRDASANEAVFNYKMAIRLNPDTESGKESLKRLRANQ
jgi:hypothetical protein